MEKYGVILAGGRGERFWPLSRKKMPKQFLKFLGEKSMFIQTYERFSTFIPQEHIYIVTTPDLHSFFKEEGIHNKNILIEPEGKNTLYAIAYAAATIVHENRDGIMVISPSDHYIGDEKLYIETIRKGFRYAEGDYLITFGIKPTRPDTGYGYIETSDEGIEKDIYKVKRFTEKPNQKRAKEFLISGNFLWNSGIFEWRAKSIIGNIKKFQQGLAEPLENMVQTLSNKSVQDFYSAGEPISIDYGVMESSNDVFVIRADFPWDDIGNWKSLERIIEKDKDENIVLGEYLGLDSEENIVYTNGGIIATYGINNLIIVHTKDATMVVNKRDAQEVKLLVKELEKRKLDKYL